MDETQFEDLKQFVSTTVGQAEAHLSGRLDKLAKDLADGFAGAGDAIEQLGDHIDEITATTHKHTVQLTDHEQRITTIEQDAA